ncbi:MAG: class II aldolase/adducin family protein [Acidobacteriota bacterium]
MTTLIAQRNSDLEEAMIQVGRRLWEREFISGTGGNFSARLDDNHILSTPAGVAKGRLTPDDLVVTDLEGTRISGRLQPSSELRIHLASYRLRPEVHAVVHAHPKTVVAHSLASINLMFTALPETVAALGMIRSVPYETPGTSALALKMEGALADHNAVVMERHGAITLGRTLLEAYDRMETLEHAAQTLYLAETLGTIEALPDDEIDRLLDLVK